MVSGFGTDCVKLLGDDKKETCDKVAGIASKVGNAIGQVSEAFMRCGDGLVSYGSGMLCLACSKNWPDFISNKDLKIRIAQATCAQVVNECSPINTSYINLLKLVQELMKESGLNVFVKASSAIDSAEDFCGGTVVSPGDCILKICQDWLVGVNAGIDGPTSRRRALTSGVTGEEGRMGDLISNLVEAAMTYIDATQNHHRTLQEVKSGGSSRVLASDQYTNEYVATGGYDPIRTSCVDNPKQAICPQLAIGAIVGGTVGGLVAVILIALVVYKLRQRRADAAPRV